MTLFKNIIVSNPYKDLDKFEETVVLAKEAGVTHVSVSYPAEKSRWELDDPNDPYLHWSIIHNAVFKVVPPEALKEWIPEDFAQRNFELIKKRCQIIKKHGMKASFLVYEPLWWPEPVFEKYPHLRGPRVDHPRRSRHPRFSPNLFHDEVLEMYSYAIGKILDEAPQIDMFIFSTNDSSTGLPWADRLYNSPNGPGAGFTPIGENVAKFITGCEKAAEGSQNPLCKFFIRGQMSGYELESLRQHLKGPDGAVKMAFFSFKPIKEEAIQGLRSMYLYPVKDIGQPFSIMRNLIEAKKRGGYGILLNPMAEAYITEWDAGNLDLQVLNYFQTYSPENDFEIFTVLSKLMDQIYGKEWGHRMLQAHSWLDRARTLYSTMEGGGTLLLLWVVAQRWITRPMVVFPEQLSDEEKAYFRQFQFQALTETEANNPLNAQGYQMVKGEHQGFFFGNLLETCRNYINQAIACVDQENSPEMISSFVDKLKCWDILLQTCFNFIRFYTLLDRVKENAPKDEDGNLIPPEEINLLCLDGDPEREKLYNLYRAEIDNAAALIKLLSETNPAPLILSDSPDKEDIFVLSSDIVSQLQTKKKLMLDHWLDLDQLLHRPNY